MLLREKSLIFIFSFLCLLGIVDIYTPWGNRIWENYIGFHGRFAIMQDNKLGYVNGRSKLLIKPAFDDGVQFFKDGLAPTAIGGKWGYIDTEGRWKISPQYMAAGKFQEKLAAVYTLSDTGFRKFGFIDESGTLRIPAVYTQANGFSDGLAAVKMGDVWGFIDQAGTFVIQPKFEDALDFSEGLAAVKTQGRWGFVERSGFFLIRPQFDEVKSFADGHAPAKRGLNWGYIDRLGKWTVEPKWLTAESFSEGLAAVDGGYIDTQGNMVIASPTFGKLRDFSEGLAAVEVRTYKKSVSSSWGYIDRNGTFVLQPRFQLAWDFKGGLARVSKDKNNLHRGYIHKDGTLVWDPVDWEQSSDFKRNLKTTGIVLLFIFVTIPLSFLRNRQKNLYYVQTIN